MSINVQEETEKKRRQARKENRERAVQLLREGRGREAKEYFQRCVDITPDMAQHVIRAARERNIDCIVAPYEADAQLAYLAMSGLADIVVTEDSDLTLFGCQKILFKLIDSGDCVLYQRDQLGQVFGLQADHFSFDKFRYMCIMSGCDYLASLPGIGLGKAKSFWQKVTNPDLSNVLRKIPAYLKMPQISVSQDYIDRFIRANNTFLYQLVFDPVTRTERPVTPYPQSLNIDSLTYCGSYSPPHTALQMALGNMNIFTKIQVDDYDPDTFTVDNCEGKTRYGMIAAHRSMWRKEFLSEGPAINKSTVNKSATSSFAFEMKETHRAEVSSSQVSSVRTSSKGVEKRKVEISEDEVEKLLDEDNSPPLKKHKSDALKFSKVVGLSSDHPGDKKVVSKYFSSKKSVFIESSQVKRDHVPQGRRERTEDSGSWFGDIDKPAATPGFIYRPESQLRDQADKVLQEISNSPHYPESEEKKQRRNPFAKNLRSSVESVRLTANLDVDLTEASQDSVATITSSQLSICSVDPESLTFTSQTQESESKDQSPGKASSPVLKPSTGRMSGAPRVGLSRNVIKNSSSSSTQPSSISQSNNSSLSSKSRPGGARVSGLCRTGGNKSSDGMKQTSLAMFVKTNPKANLGKPKV